MNVENVLCSIVVVVTCLIKFLQGKSLSIVFAFSLQIMIRDTENT